MTKSAGLKREYLLLCPSSFCCKFFSPGHIDVRYVLSQTACHAAFCAEGGDACPVLNPHWRIHSVISPAIFSGLSSCR